MNHRLLLIIILVCLSLVPSFGQTSKEKEMSQLGLVNIIDVCPDVKINILYATENNFMGYVLYDDIFNAYMLPEVAKAIVEVSKNLKKINASYSLLIYDAARPISVQQKMWDSVEGTKNEPFVSNPSNGGGLHNYGAAVDVTIIDENNEVLDMGTAYDYFGDEAYINNENLLVEKGKISAEARNNRLLLRKLMKNAGFKTLSSEWWHFNYYTRDYAKKNLKLIK